MGHRLGGVDAARRAQHDVGALAGRGAGYREPPALAQQPVHHLRHLYRRKVCGQLDHPTYCAPYLARAPVCRLSSSLDAWTVAPATPTAGRRRGQPGVHRSSHSSIEPAADWKPEGDFSDIRYETADGIAKITINRPHKRNAFRPQTLFELERAFTLARDDDTVGVIILTGAGDWAFCPEVTSRSAATTATSATMR